MRRKITALNTCIEFTNGSEVGMDLSTLRNALDRQVRVSCGLDQGDVYVCPLESTPHDVIICDFCGDSDKLVGPLVEGKALRARGMKEQDAYICTNCINFAFELVKSLNVVRKTVNDIPTPRERA